MFSLRLRPFKTRLLPSIVTQNRYLYNGCHRLHQRFVSSALRRPVLRVTCFASLYCCYYYLNSNFNYKDIYGLNSLMSFMRFAECLREDDNRRQNKINSPKEHQLFAAIKSGDISSVQKLINEKTIDVNCRHEYGWTPLLLAAVNGWTDICQLLLDSGADINITDEFSSAQKMSLQKNYNYLKVLMSRELEFSDLLSARVSFRGTTALHYAVLADNIETVELLMKRGADPNVENEIGHKAIDYVKEDNKQLRKMLAEYESKFSEIMAQKELEERLRFPLEERIKRVIVGQMSAITTVSAAIRRKQNGWYDENKPLVFLFLGSSGNTIDVKFDYFINC